MTTYTVALDDTPMESQMLRCLICDAMLAHDYDGLESHYRNMHQLTEELLSADELRKRKRKQLAFRMEQKKGPWYFIGRDY